ncbi:MAG TPA: hypothetical protein PKD16_14120 [Saprospiraceae bacterium]|jgi:hypothetical protein|nr:hypothetical protein [Saprospiraceae bacterium]HMT71298.1 hypothetical protein [Saprospiraceae bacterium]
MKRNKFIFSVLVGFVVLILSCSKDESQNTILNTGLQTRTSTPSIINGMLSFSTYQDFENFVTNLKNQEQDSTTVRNAFTTLGIDLNAEPTTNITDYPVCRLKENEISGFTSARRIEEDAINANLNAGGDAFSIIDDVYLKTVLNGDKSVHIGTRIFKFYDNSGVAIVLNNDWTKYNAIKNHSYDALRQTGNLIVTNDTQESWDKFYNIGSDGKVSTEKTYVTPTPTNPESPLACDFSDALVVTNLSGGKIRVELPSQIYDIYEWTFSDGSKASGNPLIIDCNQKSNGTVTLDVWALDTSVPAGKRRICRGTVAFFCNCGEKKSINKEIIRTVNGQTWRIQASMWVKSKEVGCEMSYKKKGLFGIWLPASNKGVCTDLNGTYKRELANKSCIDVSGNGIKCLGNGTFPTSISVKISDVDKIFREPSKLSSGHRVNVKGTWFGFGINGVPRLILD